MEAQSEAFISGFQIHIWTFQTDVTLYSIDLYCSFSHKQESDTEAFPFHMEQCKLKIRVFVRTFRTPAADHSPGV